MKNLLFALAFVLCSCLNVFSQATSLTVDCQNPGWLASYIGPENLSSIRNLTVTGQINGTDLATIGNLVKNYSLQGHLDLGDVTISENTLTAELFGVTNCKLEYLALPKSIGIMDKCVEWVEIDTLVCGCVEQPDFRMGYSVAEGNYTDYCSNISTFNVKHLILREGTKSIKIFSEGRKNYETQIYVNNVLESILFPNGIKHLNYFYNLKNLSYMNVPEGVETLGLRLHTNIHIQSDTLFIPSSVRTFYDTWAGYDYRNAYINPNTRNPNGRIKCLYLPDNLETFWVDALINGAQVDIHIKAKNPPKIENGLFNSNTIVYVPVGYKDVYKATGNSGSGGRAQWGGATILEEVYAERIDINVPEILYVGDSQLLKTDFTPSNTTFKDVAWGVSDSETLSLTQDGTCTALSYGTVQVTAINADRSCTDTKTLKVYDHTTGVNISKSALKLMVGEKASLIANTLPIGTSDDMITWSSNDETVATVDSRGNVKGIGLGSCTITATSVDGGYTATCEVTVTQPVESLTMEKHSITLKVGESEKLFAQISPATADDKKISWHSSNEQIASVDANGNVIAQKAGEVWIKAISNDNAEAKDSCKVIVSQPVTGIQLDKMTYQLNGIGNSFELKATVTPDDASNKNIKWKSTDETVCVASHGQANASVNPNCTITSTGKGTCTIIASTEDGGYTAICSVTVAIPKYKLIYKVDGEVYKTYELEQGLIITPEPAPTKEGYTFSGWNEMPETMPTHDVTVTGTFTINKYNLTYNVDGEEYKTVEVEYGKEITPETEPTKDGYVFSGWVGLPATMPAKDVTVAGTFSKGAFKLIYLVDGEVYKTMAYNLDDAITPEPAPTKEGYTFSGWSEIPATMPANDVTVTGTFTINKYKLIYNVDGEEYKTVEVEYGKAITPESEPTKDGYVFSGWVGLPATMPAKDVTVAGSFNKEEFKLIYLVDGEVYKTMVYSLGDAITPEAEPEEEGYTFSGWSEIPATMPAEDVTVIGTFTINKYKLTYVIDGDEYKSIEIEYGKTITPEAEPTKEGYTFSGWGTIPTTMPAKDVTISGTFSKGAYKLVYKVDDVAYKTVSYDFGDAITPEAEPTKEGYTFSGWSEIPATMPAEDITVSGTFTVNKYKLTYVIDGETYKTYEVEYGAAIKIEPDPTKEGFDFSGWDNVPQTMPAEDVTITGTFTPTTGIAGIVTSGKPFDIYSLSGVLLKRYVTSFDGLPAGLYIVNGRKVHVK